MSNKNPLRTVELPFPKKRLACFFCAKPLIANGHFVDLQICTSRGIAILACLEHANHGNEMVAHLNTVIAQHQKPVETRAE